MDTQPAPRHESDDDRPSDTRDAPRHESDDHRPSDTRDASDSLSTPDLRPAAPVRRYGGSAPVASDPTAPLERAARNTPAPRRAPVIAPVSPAAPAREPVLRGDETTERFAAATAALRLDDTQRDAVTAVLGQPRAGLYLHGPVGRGKSMLAELYLATFDPDTSLRLHLNELFRRLQAELIREWKAPAIVLRRLLGPVRALLVDEFHVHDVADAVYLSALLEVVAEDRIVLIATSNYAPHDLMPDPKLHERFLPAIERITAELGVIAVGSGPDHRALGDDGRATFVSGRWTITPGIPASPTPGAPAPATPGAPASPTPGVPASALEIDGIPLHPLEMADGRIAFDFAGICDAAVGVRQYQGIADRFETVEVRGVPDLAVVRREPLMRFATLVDVLYDHDVRLVVTSAAPFERLTDAEAPPVDSDRVISRLRALRG